MIIIYFICVRISIYSLKLCVECPKVFERVAGRAELQLS